MWKQIYRETPAPPVGEMEAGFFIVPSFFCLFPD